VRGVRGHCHENRGKGLEVMGHWREKKKLKDKSGGPIYRGCNGARDHGSRNDKGQVLK
jgi:hypothetical protein